MRAWQHIRATLLLPVMATIVIPATLLSVFGWDSIGVWGIHPAIRPTLSIIGAVLSLAGFGRYDIPLSEEPGLVKRFGDEYEVNRRNVSRWMPRLTPWGS